MENGYTVEKEERRQELEAEPGKVLRDPEFKAEGEWEAEELEERITRVLFAVYDTRFHPPVHPRRMSQEVVPTRKEIQKIREIGAYFTPGDVLMRSDYVDVKRHGLPNRGCFFTTVTEKGRKESMVSDPRGNAFDDPTSEFYLPGMYLKGGYSFLNQKLPSGWMRRGGGYIYSCIMFYAGETGIVWQKSYVTIDQNTGKVTGAIRTINKHKRLHEDEQHDYDTRFPTLVSCNLSNEGERMFLWNVTALEGPVRACFGVHEEQVKSLFYARDLPLTDTGRKRPILHWVAAHRRRIKEGIDIDVRKHMRGITGFEMFGTKFEIGVPEKKEEEREARRLRRKAAMERVGTPPPVEVPELLPQPISKTWWDTFRERIADLFH